MGSVELPVTAISLLKSSLLISKISSAFCVLCSRGAIKARCRFCVRQALQTHASSKAECHPPLHLCTLRRPAATPESVLYCCCTASLLCYMHRELLHNPDSCDCDVPLAMTSTRTCDVYNLTVCQAAQCKYACISLAPCAGARVPGLAS